MGNTLVIAAVITTRRLRSVTNCFVSSLAAADLLVGLAVMPPAVLLQVYKSIFKTLGSKNIKRKNIRVGKYVCVCVYIFN